MNKVLDLSIGDIGKNKDIIETITIYFLCLVVPAFLEKILNIGNIQYIVGSIVNTLLFISAYNLKGKYKIIGLCTMPSLSTMLSGYLFGFNKVTLLMIPFIWIGNFILIYSTKYLVINKNKNIYTSGLISIISKVLVIFLGFLLITRFVNLPDNKFSILLSSMSYMQCITAFIGFIIANTFNNMNE